MILGNHARIVSWKFCCERMAFKTEAITGVTDHAALVVEPPLEVPQPTAPEVGGTLAQEGRQLGLKEALNVGMSPLPKHSPYILILQLPVQQPLVSS